MKTLVTGGCGFLGSHLTEELAEREEKITVVDNFSTNVVGEDFFASPTTVLRMTTDYYSRNYGFDEFGRIYHVASVVGPAGVIPHTGNIARSIVDDASAMAKKAIANDSLMLFVSTSEVYGGGQNTEEEWCSVSSTPSPRLEYAVGKLASEVMLRNLAEYEGLKVVIARPFNIAGPRQSEKGGFVIPRFIQSALKSEDISVFGDGSALRAFTHVKDIAHGLVMLMDGLEDGTIPSGSVFNIGNALSQTTIKELATTIIHLTESESGIDYVDPTTIFGEHYVEAPDKLPDATKLIETLNWEPTRTLEELLIEAVEWERWGKRK